ncbi:shikimate kinase AroL [Affinibrenneria salicis]|uniref:Shikimate kinase 2 n=1 Tax=Affinibrenneria salicis TaxID=2590031 RepID=A0A5J5FTA6_9GAMM|nr:shikimate kinase AroL [Affinibrenneria salicis]KAA8996172.1 shikimate kinase AroL [Affinibrenneria salicis]
MTQPIFMVGARGCGKSTIGYSLAQLLEYDFVDTDHFMQQSCQKTVAEIVVEEGWQGFRQRESEALREVTHKQKVIATGGGMVLAEENRRFMQENGWVIYLHAPASVLAQRLMVSPQADQRPTLTGRPIAEEMVDVLAAREALYRSVAHHILDATRSPAQVAREVVRAMEAAGLMASPVSQGQI